jgi:parvulin-like peptidyl-prolyl isomerase
VAKARSQDTQNAKIGGDLGWIVKKDVPKEFEPVLALKEGELSEPIESKFGWHVVKVVAIEAPKQIEFDAAKDEAKKKLLERRRTEARARWVAQLRAAASIEVNNAKLKAFAKENSVN